tara:strand:+ start:859 stop:1905 length:1047 start_codon:yes stop_codon:yes gene_type:complete
MKKQISFSILGLGRVIDKRAFYMFKNEITNGYVKAIFDINKKKTKKYEKLFKCRAKNSLNKFLSVKSDYVYIATESGNHFKHILKCFEFNRNVIVEKPPVLKVKELEFLNKIAQKKKLKFYTVFQNRLNKSVEYVKKIIKKEKLIFVDLSLIWSRSQEYYKDWHGNWKLDGGVLAQQGIHYVDLLIYLFGDPKKCVSSLTNKVNKLQAEDTHSSLIIFKKNNLSCTVNMSTAFRPRDFEASINIYCKKRIISLGGLCCNKVSISNLEAGSNKFKMIKKFTEKVSSGYGISHKKVFQKIIDHELNRKKTPLKAYNTLSTIKLINMMYKSFDQNRWINFNEKQIISKLGK